MDEWIHKSVVYKYNGILFNNKQEQSTDTWHNLDEPWKHYVKKKKLDTKSHILCDPFYMA